MYSVIAICDPVCENGGTCVYPHNCTCLEGWTGARCEQGKSMQLAYIPKRVQDEIQDCTKWV